MLYSTHLECSCARSEGFEMAVAAYASLLSLTHVLDNVQHPARRQRLHLDTDRVQSLQEKVEFLLDFLEVHSQSKSQEMRDLARQIAIVATEADDVIDLHVVDQLREGSQDQSHHPAALSSFCQGVDKVIEKIDSITKELMMVNLEKSVNAGKPLNVSSTFTSGRKNIMVGLHDHLDHILDVLIIGGSNLQILSIVGTGGMGKTTLAKNAFEHQQIANRFDIRIWLTVSQEYNARKILLGLLNDGKIQESGETFTELGERLHKRLSGEKYLIVVDDLWSIKFWDDLKLFFPNNRNGSRIIVTTRLSDVSLWCHLRIGMRLLNLKDSWHLFCEKVFAQQDCPYYPELMDVGREITKHCRGHPLAILVISGLLGVSNMEQVYWKFIAETMKSLVFSEDDFLLQILSLCYNYLPIYLKPCFLYMGIFPEDHRIEVSELITLWVGEGFLRPIRDKTLEEVANEYLEELVARNLILIHKWTGRGTLKVVGVHDLLRDLCLREFEKEHFIRVPKIQRINLFREMGKMCFLCGDQFSLQEGTAVQFLDSLRSTSVAGGLVCKACKIMYPDLTRLRLKKVFGQCCHEQHTKLRYINIRAPNFWERIAHYEVDFVSPSRLHLLWNLQTLSIDSGTGLDPMVLPSKIWEMPQLRHIMVKLAILPNPLDTQDATILENLGTLSFIHNLRCTKEILEKIPNLKKLKVCYSGNLKGWSYYCLYNLVHLHKLESLYLITKDLLSEKIAFPTSLKKLTLSGCKLPWEDMTIIGSALHKLEVLKLYNNAFKGSIWKPIEGQFTQLKVLSIWFSDLVCWRANHIHFPNLERLFLGYMNDLREIPSDIGKIQTLRSIHLNDCGDSAVNSAKQILEKQGWWYKGLQVHVDEDWN